MDIMDAINRKRAVRDYLQESITDLAALQILAAGRRAQSSRNNQPWHFIAVRDRQMLAQLSTTGRFSAHVAQASLCVVIVLPDPAESPVVLFDAGQAAAYMQLAALEFGIGSCVVKLHHTQPAKELLNIPADRHVIYAIAFGYPADPNAVQALPQQIGRKSLKEIVHWDSW